MSGKKEKKDKFKWKEMDDLEGEEDKEYDSHVTTKTRRNTTQHSSAKITTDALLSAFTLALSEAPTKTL